MYDVRIEEWIDQDHAWIDDRCQKRQWEAARASGSYVLLLPPIWIQQQLHAPAPYLFPYPLLCPYSLNILHYYIKIDPHLIVTLF